MYLFAVSGVYFKWKKQMRNPIFKIYFKTIARIPLINSENANMLEYTSVKKELSRSLLDQDNIN